MSNLPDLSFDLRVPDSYLGIGSRTFVAARPAMQVDATQRALSSAQRFLGMAGVFNSRFPRTGHPPRA